MSNETLDLTDAPRTLSVYGEPPTCQRLWIAAVAGRIPAKKVGKRWMVRVADLEQIAQIFNLV